MSRLQVGVEKCIVQSIMHVELGTNMKISEVKERIRPMKKNNTGNVHYDLILRRVP